MARRREEATDATTPGPPTGCGTVYSINTTGSEKVLYPFAGGSDGKGPGRSVVRVGADLYGTTSGGGGCTTVYTFCGTVYRVTLCSTPPCPEQVVYAFTNRSKGDQPSSGLVKNGGPFFGTTYYGGGKGCLYNGSNGCGLVYRVNRSGAEKVLHRFVGGTDGAFPDGDLLNVNGTLYGTTTLGGSSCYGGRGCGVVYSITPDGTEKVLHSFSRGADGWFPHGGLIDVNGTLYGTTQRGGAYCNSGYGAGCGTVYSITPCSNPPCTETVLYSFGGTGDGSYPDAGLIFVKGKLSARLLVVVRLGVASAMMAAEPFTA